MLRTLPHIFPHTCNPFHLIPSPVQLIYSTSPVPHAYSTSPAFPHLCHLTCSPRRDLMHISQACDKDTKLYPPSKANIILPSARRPNSCVMKAKHSAVTLQLSCPPIALYPADINTMSGQNCSATGLMTHLIGRWGEMWF